MDKKLNKTFFVIWVDPKWNFGKVGPKHQTKQMPCVWFNSNYVSPYFGLKIWLKNLICSDLIDIAKGQN